MCYLRVPVLLQAELGKTVGAGSSEEALGFEVVKAVFGFELGRYHPRGSMRRRK